MYFYGFIDCVRKALNAKSANEKLREFMYCTNENGNET